MHPVDEAEYLDEAYAHEKNGRMTSVVVVEVDDEEGAADPFDENLASGRHLEILLSVRHIIAEVRPVFEYQLVDFKLHVVPGDFSAEIHAGLEHGAGERYWIFLARRSIRKMRLPLHWCQGRVRNANYEGLQ